ncbi:MAG: 2-hydroxyacid dehydrogenase, partial [Bdellovibrionaceae bacterium]|nr:2-hydroxyacid dehydrogenase [Pseudobdellovibrionaceae bacterium]
MQKIKLLMTGTQTYEEQIFKQVLQSQSEIEITYCKERLNEKTSPMAMGYDGAICFVNDDLKATCLQHLKQSQLKVLFLRSAGYNHVDLTTARDLGLSVYRVPAYSPEAVAEHALTLLMTLNRKVHKSYNRVREMNFSVDGLVGFNLQSITVGIVGTGNFGRAFA